MWFLYEFVLIVDDDDVLLFRRLSLHHLRNTQKCGAKKYLETHRYHTQCIRAIKKQLLHHQTQINQYKVHSKYSTIALLIQTK